MRRTKQLQGLRLMKFEDVHGRCLRGDLNQGEAAEILNVLERTFRRWRDRWEAESAEGLRHRDRDTHGHAPGVDAQQVPCELGTPLRG